MAAHSSMRPISFSLRAVNSVVAIVEPEKREAEQRNENVGVEDRPRIAWSKIMRAHHLPDMADGRSECEDAGPDHRHETAVESPESRNEPGNGESKARGAYFELEWAVAPANEGCSHWAKKHMKNEIDEIHNADVEEHVPGQKLIDDDRAADWPRSARDRDRGDDQPDNKESEWVIGYHENDGRSDHVIIPCRESGAARRTIQTRLLLGHRRSVQTEASARSYGSGGRQLFEISHAFK
jgi:hypothetical protein